MVNKPIKFSSNKEILSYINSMEVKLTKDKVLFFGKNFWPVIRLQIAFSLIHKNQKVQKIVGSGVNKLPKPAKKFSSLPCENQLLISHDNYYVEIDGKRYDRVLEKIKKNSSSPIVFNIADNSFYLGEDDEPLKNISIQLFLLKGLSFLIGTAFNLIQRNRFKFFERLQIIEPEVNQPIVRGRDIGIRICYVLLLSKYINHLLKAFNINQIYQAMYYDNFGLATGLAAHNLGLVNHCVQHGGQSENNPAFGSWSVMSDIGFEFLPDYFLCWNEASSKSIDFWSQKTSKHSSKVIGYSWMELWKDDLNRKYNSMSLSSNHNPNILITLQPSVNLKETFLYDFIRSSDLEVNWILRLHPRQESDTFMIQMKEYFLESENVCIKSSKDPLPFLMTHSKLHVTFFSSSVYEAKFCDLKSVIIDKRGLDYFPDLLENGDAEIALEAHELKEIIQKIL